MTRPLTDSTAPAPFALKRGPYQRRKPNANPEAKLQATVVQYLKLALPADVLWTATLNGISMTMFARTKAKAQGMRPGISDLIVVIPGKGARFIELKSDVGRLSDEQKEWAAALRSWWATCRSVEEVADALTSWGIQLRHRPIDRHANP